MFVSLHPAGPVSRAAKKQIPTFLGLGIGSGDTDQPRDTSLLWPERSGS